MTSPILLIACGGNSDRMGTDKSQLNYHGKPQYLYLIEQLHPYFADIYISIRKKQEAKFSSVQNVIIDEVIYSGHGPVSGLLSFHSKFKKKSVVYLGCDYPFLSVDDVLKLTTDNNVTCAYFQDHYEPLLAHYTPNSLNLLESEFNAGRDSLQKFLNKIAAMKISVDYSERIKSVDTPEEYKIALTKIKQDK